MRGSASAVELVGTYVPHGPAGLAFATLAVTLRGAAVGPLRIGSKTATPKANRASTPNAAVTNTAAVHVILRSIVGPSSTNSTASENFADRCLVACLLSYPRTSTSPALFESAPHS